MRIVKDAAASALRREAAELDEQGRRCQAQIDKLSGWGLDAMSGKGIVALDQNIRMQAATVRAHRVFFAEVAQADRACAQLVDALPTTSAGVVDTEVAQERISAAQGQLRLLAEQREREAAQGLLEDVGQGFAITPSLPDVRYRMLADEQERIVRYNRSVIEEVERLEAEVARSYRQIMTFGLRRAATASRLYVQTGDWGNTRWADTLLMGQRLSAYKASDNWGRARKTPQELFWEGGLKAGDAAATATVETSRNGLDTEATGELLGFGAKLVPYADHSHTVGKPDKYQTYGVTASAEAYMARGEVQENGGLISGKLSGGFLTGKAEVHAGGSVVGEQDSLPSLGAVAEAEACAASVGAQMSLGVDDFNYRSGVQGKGPSFAAEAGLTITNSGSEAKAGAEAYLVSGSVSGGMTFLGIKLDTTVSAKVAGAGAKAAAQVSTGAAAGELALGLGVGLGVKVKVDWSGVSAAVGRTRETVTKWWDTVVLGKDDDHA